MNLQFLQKFIDKIRGKHKNPISVIYRKLRNEMRLSGPNKKPVIIFASSYNYFESMPQRPNHILKHFADMGYLVLWPDEYVKKITPINKNILLFPYKFLKEFLTTKKFSKVIMTISTHYTMPNLEKYLDMAVKSGDCVLFEHLDEINLVPNLTERTKLQARFESVCKNKQINIIATAEALFQQALDERLSDENVFMSKNAVNPEDFAFSKFTNPPLEIKDIVSKNKPIVGYYGSLSSRWFAVEMFNEVIKQNPRFEFVLIGHKGDSGIDKMAANENCTIIPAIAYSDIPKFAKYFDISVIPFLVNDITKATSPVKLFEYMSMGLPIIATPIDECKLYKSCLIANNATEFGQLLEKAISLKTNPDYQQILECEALENTWKMRTDHMINIINERQNDEN